jgi:hypothetical protein
VLILFYLGGIIILFIYIVSLTPIFKARVAPSTQAMGGLILVLLIMDISFRSPSFITFSSFELGRFYYFSFLNLLLFLRLFLLLIL